VSEDGHPVSEQRPPVERWRGHLDVPRPRERPRLGRRFYLILAAAFLAGLFVLGGLALWAQLAESPDFFSWGAGIILLACFLLAAKFSAPFSYDPFRAGWDAREKTLPLITPALALVAFALPSLAALVVLTVVALQAR
jgi:hypothetical protein